MPREIEGYSIEVCGEKDYENSVCECFPTWDEAVKRLSILVEEKAEQYNIKPICLLRVSSQETCHTSGIASVYSFTKAGIIIQIRALFRETSSLQDLPGGLSSSAN